MLRIRKSNDRGYANHGWLNTKYTFSFANYYDPNFMGFGHLLVINEDKISPGMGFGEHPHEDMEIITYVIQGAVAHKDSMGHQGIVRPGEIQYMSAGTGIRHSEFNHLKSDETHLLQIWILPDRKGHVPNYGQASYLDRLKANELCLLVSNDGRDSSIKVHQDCSLFTARLGPSKTINYQFEGKRNGWIQLVSGSIFVNGIEISAGDGLYITNEDTLQLIAKDQAEFLFFDLK